MFFNLVKNVNFFFLFFVGLYLLHGIFLYTWYIPLYMVYSFIHDEYPINGLYLLHGEYPINGLYLLHGEYPIKGLYLTHGIFLDTWYIPYKRFIPYIW